MRIVHNRGVLSPADPVRAIPGTHSSRAKILEENGLATVRDLLWFFPYRYEDRRHPVRIADLGKHVDEPVVVRGRVLSAHMKISPRKRMKIFEAAIEATEVERVMVWRCRRP